jgi:hypothetical protein
MILNDRARLTDSGARRRRGGLERVDEPIPLGNVLRAGHLNFAPLFGHQYSHIWIDFRGIQDSFMQARGIDYFENSRRATYAQRAYAAANPLVWRGYSDSLWGLTASDGPTNALLMLGGRRRKFQAY